MSTTILPIQCTDTGLSARAGSAIGSVFAHATAASAVATPAFGGTNPVVGMTAVHMNTGWLGGGAETGCVQNTYVTKRINTGRLDEVST